jgi:lysyl-tRNA synthetase, class II
MGSDLAARAPTVASDPGRSRPRRAAVRAAVPRVTAAVLAVIATLCGVAALAPMARGALAGVLDVIDHTVLGASPNLPYAVFLALLAAATARRKRVAFWILFTIALIHAVDAAAVLVTLAFAPDELNGVPLGTGDYVRFGATAVWQLVVLGLLLLARKEFPARVQRASFRRALGLLLGGIATEIGLGYLLATVFPGSLGGPEDRLAWVADVVLGGATDLTVNLTGRGPTWLNLLLGVIGALLLLVSMRVLLASQRAAAGLHGDQERRLRDLLTRHGEQDSLGYFATRRDKSAIFARSGRSAVTYRVELGVSLASGDPIGDPDSWEPAIEAWLAQARAYAWIPAVMGASGPGARAYSRAGLRVLEIGDEAVLHPADFDLQARELRPVAATVRRLQTDGHSVRIRRHAEISPGELSGLVGLADRWRVGGTERGFSMALSRLGDPADGRCLMVEALDATGRTVGLLSFVPWGARGLSLDLMRRDPDAGNGLTELMIATLATRGRELGIDRISLNFAVFRSAFEDGARIGAGPVARSWRRLLLLASRWWQLESLYRANAKYHPEWVPRFVCFAERRELVRISLASLVAEGFLRPPGPAPRLAVPERAAAAGSGTAPAAEPAAVASGEPAPVAVREPAGEQIRVRTATLQRIRAAGVDPYPVNHPRTASCGELRQAHQGLAPDTGTGRMVTIAGRVMRIRDHGGVVFALLRDASGDLQLIVTPTGVGTDRHRDFGADVDLGDHLGVTGEVVTSRRGELSLLAESWAMTSKCLRPLPEKRRGLTDPELRVRHRHLDLIVRPQARRAIAARSAILGSLRDSLHEHDYLEVETPQLHAVHGGATARPFRTHMSALNLPLFLRIAPELYLKRLCVGGLERVFELGRAFRNEGVSHKHNPEFTLLEAYQAYADYQDMLRLTQELIQRAAVSASGSAVALTIDGTGRRVEHDLSGDWPVVTVNQAVSAALGEHVDAGTDDAGLRRHAAAAGVAVQPSWSRGAVLLELYEHLVEARTTVPTFYCDFPSDVSPLTRPHRDDPRLAERWDLVAFGCELGTAYSELIDPTEQRRRLTEQSLLAAGGDPEAMQLDEDFLAALEVGMPPTGGLGLGVDRLVMTLTGQSIRETLAFPLIRPRTRG